jgi:hypothetical protein
MRRVVFINQADIDMLGLKAGDWVDGQRLGRRRSAAPAASCWWPTTSRAAASAPTTRRPIRWCRYSVADGAGTPTSKSIPVLLSPVRHHDHPSAHHWLRMLFVGMAPY